jgi:hypothetical protein
VAKENPTWGEEHLAAELLLKLGIRVSPRSVRRYMPDGEGPRRYYPSSQRWVTFVRNRAQAILACDFFTTVTAGFRVLYVFVIMEVCFLRARRRHYPPRVLDLLIPIYERHLRSILQEWSPITTEAALTLAWDQIFRNPQQAFRRYQVQATVFGVVTEW